MGNFNGCGFLKAEPNNKSTLIDLQGNIVKEISLPLTAAEIMLEEPGHMLCSAPDQISIRLTAIKADQELCAGKMYLLVPVLRVQSKLSEAELGFIIAAADRKNKKKSSSSPKRRRSSSKVLPTAAEEDVCAADVNLKGGDDSERCCRRLIRPWTPSLEPVSEE